MNELEDVRRFVAEHSPFDALTDAQLTRCVRGLRVTYVRRGEKVFDVGEKNEAMRLLRSGAVEVLIGGTELAARLGEGQSFGHPSLLRDGTTRSRVVALEDSLLYELDQVVFHELCRENESFAKLVAEDESCRLRDAIDARRSETTAFQLGVDEQVGKLLRRAALVASLDDTVAEVARRMAEYDASTMPILDGETLIGIVTDRDLRRRVLGGSIPVDATIGEAMTPDPITVEESADVSSALVVMADRDIHHLPVVDGKGRVLGVLSSNDLLSRFSTHALHVVRAIRAAPDAGEVAVAAARREEVFLSLVDSGLGVVQIQRFLSTIAEATHRRLAELGEERLGAPPVPYALVVFGSLARSEVAMGADQDNGFVFSDEYDQSVHGAYFEDLARFLVDGLHSSGYPYCTGDIMATNERWARPAREWRDRFRLWIETPDPNHLLQTSIFFDMRAVHGEIDLVTQLRAEVGGFIAGQTLFLSHIAREASVANIPLGFFRDFVLRPGDDGRADALDLKKDAIATFVAIARVHALACGSLALCGVDRLRSAVAAESLNEGDAEELISAWEFIGSIRVAAQAGSIRRGEDPSNRVDPRELSRFDRQHLKDAFRVLRRHQEMVLRHYAGGIR